MGLDHIKRNIPAVLCRSKYLILALFVIGIGVFIRLQNLELLEWRYPLGLDPYIFLRYARAIVEDGGLMDIDMMRNYPLGFDVTRETLMVSHIVVILFKIMKPFIPGLTLEMVHILYPVIFFALGALFFYLLNKELFCEKTALLATGLLVIIPSYLFRTMAGFADKEAIGMFFMLSALTFTVKSIKPNTRTRKIVYASLSGLMTGFMAMSWGGFRFLLIIIPAYYLILFLFKKTAPADRISYISWTFWFSIPASLGTLKYGGIIGLMTSTTTAFAYILAIIFLFSYLISFKTIKRLSPSSGKILISFAALALIIPLWLSGMTGKITEEVMRILLSGMAGDRLMMTVAEARVPYLTDWLSIFGLFFFIFFLGAAYMFYLLVKRYRYRIALTASFAAALFGVISSRISPTSTFDGSFHSTILLVLPLLSFIFIIGYGYTLSVYHGDWKKLTQLKEQYIFFLLWFFIMAIAARSGMRLFFVLAPVVCSAAAFLTIELFKKSLRQKDQFYKWSAIAALTLLIVPQIIAFGASSYSQATYTAPSFNSQWKYAMDWLQESTEEDAVIAHWWDYGYWVQAEGRRATITDGGNFIPYWNHLIGRHVLSARSEMEALEFLYSHDATHLLIISDEIGKYQAYSSIGSDENFDIFSWIGTFLMEPQATTQEDDIFTYHFRGAVALDSDLITQDRVFPRKETYILGIRIPVLEIHEDYEIQQPTAMLYHQGTRQDIPIECIYDGKKRFYPEEGLKGCLRIFPRYLGAYKQENGALLYVSEKGMNALWTRLFLFDEQMDHFRLAYDDSMVNPLVHSDGTIYGPIKIWEVDYPEDMSVPPDLRAEYLKTTTPAWMNLSRIPVLGE